MNAYKLVNGKVKKDRLEIVTPQMADEIEQKKIFESNENKVKAILYKQLADGITKSKLFKDKLNKAREMMDEALKVKVVEKGKSIEDQKKDLDVSIKYVKKIKSEEKWMEAYFGSYTRPFFQMYKEIKAISVPYLGNINDAKREMEDRGIQFHREENKRLEEIRRKEEEKVETGYQKQETAENKIEAAVFNAVGKSVETNDKEKMTYRKEIDYEMIDIDIVPEEFLRPREEHSVKVKQYLRENPELEIKGIKRVERIRYVSR